MKYKLRVFIVSAILSTITVSFAASGACSGHGGVNCSAGSDTDGSVICVDGWENSSVSYASMVKCQGYSVSEPTRPPVPVSVSKTVPSVEPTVTNIAPRPTPGAKPLVTRPATSTPVKPINNAQKVETKSLATSTVQNTLIVIPQSPATKEGGLLSVFRKFKFW